MNGQLEMKGICSKCVLGIKGDRAYFLVKHQTMMAIDDNGYQSKRLAS